jgi:hypothetical protein
MNFLTSLIIVFGVAIAACVGLVQTICDLWRTKVYASPAFLEAAGKLAIAEQPDATPELSRTK